MKWLPPDSSCFKINVAGLSFKDGTGGVGAVICDRAGEVFAALSERVCGLSLGLSFLLAPNCTQRYI